MNGRQAGVGQAGPLFGKSLLTLTIKEREGKLGRDYVVTLLREGVVNSSALVWFNYRSSI